MIAGLAKFVGSKVLTAVLLVIGIVIVIWYWQLPPESKQAIWTSLKLGLLWVGFAAVVPWALFFVPGLVLRAESNLVSAAVLLGYLALDVLAALWLAGWKVSSTAGWCVLILGFLAAGVYNFIVSDFLADRAGEQL
jgi:hypothetical protein